MTDSRRDYEVVVIGAGPAGIAAACAAAECGRRVALVDSGPSPGGQIWHGSTRDAMPRSARRWMTRLDTSGATVLSRTTAFGVSNSHTLLSEHPTGRMEIGWERLVLAVGAQELFVPFPGWTLPNVMGAGGLQLLNKAGWPLEGKRVIVAGSGPLLIAVAAHLKRHGARIGCVAEQAPLGRLAKFGLALSWLAPGKLIQAAGYQRDLLGVRYRTGCWPVAAEGSQCVESVTLSDGHSTWTEPCDYLACAFGLIANLQWPRLLGCRIEGGRVQLDPMLETSVARVFCAGEVTGIGGVDDALLDGRIAGYTAAGQPDKAKRLVASQRRTRRFAAAMARAFALRSELRDICTDETIVCRCEDVTRGQIEKHDGVRSAKLQTRCGMGPCQGRICHGTLQFLDGWQSDSVRPPVFPVRVGSLTSKPADG